MSYKIICRKNGNIIGKDLLYRKITFTLCVRLTDTQLNQTKQKLSERSERHV